MTPIEQALALLLDIPANRKKLLNSYYGEFVARLVNDLKARGMPYKDLHHEALKKFGFESDYEKRLK